VSNRNAFFLFLKIFRDISLDHKSYGRLIQAIGPLTEKLQWWWEVVLIVVVVVVKGKKEAGFV